MISRFKSMFMMLILISCMQVVVVSARGSRHSTRRAGRCATKESCKDLGSKCQCYCSGIGGFRDKDDSDKPVFVADDPNKVYCYCKQWDLDAFPKGVRPPGVPAPKAKS